MPQPNAHIQKSVSGQIITSLGKAEVCIKRKLKQAF